VRLEMLYLDDTMNWLSVTLIPLWANDEWDPSLFKSEKHSIGNVEDAVDNDQGRSGISSNCHSSLGLLSPESGFVGSLPQIM
jgi:hypothetical protein